MFLGEALCILVFFGKLRANRINDEYSPMGKKPKVPVWLIAIPAFLDFVASNVSYFALNLIPSSVWQLSKGGAIITTAIFTRILLKRILTRRKVVGCVLATVGITIVGLSVVLFSDSDNKSYPVHEEIIGIAMVIGSLVFTGLQICYEERMFRLYTMDVFQLVGMEGIFGLGMNLALVVAFVFIRCPFEEAKCGGVQYLESFVLYFQQLASNTFLLSMCILEVFTIAISVSLGVTITKRISSISRALADVARTVLIWAFGFIVTKLTSYKLESDNVGQILVEMLGFVLVLTGTVTYHLKEKEIDNEPLLLRSSLPEQLTSSIQESEEPNMRASR